MRNLLLWTFFLYCTPVEAREYLRIVGSATGYPFVAMAAEHFGANPSFKTPIVESTGTGGGLKLFASGFADNHPDIVIASRKMRPEELTYAARHGIESIREIILGLDGIVLAQNRAQAPFSLTPKDLYLALAKYHLVGNTLILNPYKTWHEINPLLPHRPIAIYGPPPSSGTRAILIHKIFDPLLKNPRYAKRDLNTLTQFRSDGAYIELGENMNLMIQKLAMNPDGMAVIGYNYSLENRHQIAPVAINGIEPTETTIASQLYPLTRYFYLYAKSPPSRQKMLEAFIDEIKSHKAIGPTGYLKSKGLIALPDGLSKDNMLDLKPAVIP